MGLLSGRLTLKETANLSFVLGAATKGGLTLGRAFEILAKQTNKPRVRNLLERLAEETRQGGTLEDALRAESKRLSPFFIEVLSAGEMAGRTHEAVSELSVHYESLVKIRRAIIRQLTYPLCLIIVAFVIKPYVMGFVLTHDDTWTYTLKFILSYRILARNIALFWVFCAILNRFGLYRKILDPIKVSLWPMSKVWGKFATAMYCRSLGLLLQSGVGLPAAMERAARVTSNWMLERSFRRRAVLVKQGSTVYEALQSSRFMSRMTKELIAVGEKSGKLEETLIKTSDYLIAEATTPVLVVVTCIELFAIMAVAFMIFS